MPLIRGYEKNIKVVFEDGITREEVCFFCRMPNTEEKVDYQNMAVRRERNDLTFQVAKAQLVYGLQIIIGIRDGDFLIPIEEHPNKAEIRNHNTISNEPDSGVEGFVTISSDKDSVFYHKDWKKIVEEMASHLVEKIGKKFFDPEAYEAKQLSENP